MKSKVTYFLTRPFFPGVSESVISFNSMCSIFCYRLDKDEMGSEFSFNMDHNCHPINFNTHTPKDVLLELGVQMPLVTGRTRDAIIKSPDLSTGCNHILI